MSLLSDYYVIKSELTKREQEASRIDKRRKSSREIQTYFLRELTEYFFVAYLRAGTCVLFGILKNNTLRSD